MKTQVDITQESENLITPRVFRKPGNGGTAQLVDNRASTIEQQKLRVTMNTSSESSATPIQRKANNTGLPDTLNLVSKTYPVTVWMM